MYKKTYDHDYLDRMQKLFQDAKNRGYDLLELNKNEILIDIGCGTGQDVRALAKNCFKVIGVDHDAGLLEIAQKSESTTKNIEYICTEADAIPLQNNSIDKIRFDRVFQHIERHNETIGEAKRLLKHGGRLQIIDTDYFGMTLFLPDIELERKIINAISFNRFKGAHLIRMLPATLIQADFTIESIEIFNYIIPKFEFINEIIRFDKIVKEEYESGNITSEEISKWGVHKNQPENQFQMSVNLILINAIRN